LTQDVGLALRKAAEALENAHTTGVSLNTEISEGVSGVARGLIYEWTGGLISNKNSPFCSGEVAGNARVDIEKRTGKPVFAEKTRLTSQDY